MTSNVAKDIMGVEIEMLNSTVSDCNSVLRNKIESRQCTLSSRMKVCKDVGGKTEKCLNLNQAISMHGLTTVSSKQEVGYQKA